MAFKNKGRLIQTWQIHKNGDQQLMSRYDWPSFLIEQRRLYWLILRIVNRRRAGSLSYFIKTQMPHYDDNLITMLPNINLIRKQALALDKTRFSSLKLSPD